MVGFLIAKIQVPRARPDRRVLFLHEGSTGEEIRLELSAGTLADYDLSAGDSIGDATRRELEALAEVERCRRQAFRLLANRPRSEEELRRRLVRSDFSYLAIDRVLAELKAQGSVDDRSFATEFAAQRRRLKGHAPARVETELRARGIDRETAHRAAWDPYEGGRNEPEALQFDEALTLLRKRQIRYNGLPRVVARRRMAGLLSRAGYPTSLSLDAIDVVLDEMEEAGLIVGSSEENESTGWD